MKLQLSEDLQLNEEQKLEVLRRIERSASFQRVFQCPDGERVLKEIEKQCSDGFNPDPYVHAFNAGKAFILKFINNALGEDVENARQILERSETIEKEVK